MRLKIAKKRKMKNGDCQLQLMKCDKMNDENLDQKFFPRNFYIDYISRFCWQFLADSWKQRSLN